MTKDDPEPTVARIMTTDVETVRSVAAVREAAGRMRAFGVGMLPVVDSTGVIGVVTDRDLVLRVTAEGLDGASLRVSDVTTPETHQCGPDHTVREASWLMQIHQVRRLMVFDDRSRLVGILSLGDMARRGHPDLANVVYASLLRPTPAAPPFVWPA